MHDDRIAAMDVGSNAIRFVAAEFYGSSRYRVIDSARAAVRLGTAAFRIGELDPALIEEAASAFVGYRRRMDESGIVRHRAVATSAVRDSRNGDELVRRVRDLSGIEVEPITGREEARLVWTAVRSRMATADRAYVLVDLGGGSLEVSRVSDGRIESTVSHPLGTLRLLDVLRDREGPREIRRFLDASGSMAAVQGELAAAAGAAMIATGGNIEALAKIARSGRLGGGPDGGPRVLGAARLRRVIDRLAELTPAERMERWSLRPDRADVILPAAMIYARIASSLGADRILVPDVGVKEGILLDLASLRSD